MGNSPDFDPHQFWEPSEYSQRMYIDAPLTDELVSSIGKELGYELPSAYKEICRIQNGGVPYRTSHRVAEPTSWAAEHISISGILAIGREKPYSLCGLLGSQLMVDEWGYPPIGVYFANCPSGGHDALCLDYRECGPGGEPTVIHIDQECDYKITPVAPNFAAFLRGLVPDEEFETDEDSL